MLKQRIHVLIVDDDLVDRMACRRALAANEHADFVLSEAETGHDGLLLATDETPDCILLDYNLPDLNGLEFLQHLREGASGSHIPVVLLTGADSATVAVEAMRRGARDYLGKDADRQYLELLPGVVQRVLREQQLEEAKRQAEAKFQTVVEQVHAITYLVSADGNGALSYISPQIRMLGYSSQEWLADPALHGNRIHPSDRAPALEAIRVARESGEPMHLEYRLLARDGSAMWFRDECRAVCDETGRRLFVQGMLIDITHSKQAEEALRQSQEELRQLAAHQEHAKEEERKRIAQEIHDELGGLLTSIKAYVSVANERAVQAGADADQLLNEAARLADSAIGAVRKVITDLRPSVLDQLGIWAALEWYAGQIQERSGMECICSVSAAAQEIDIDHERSTMLFRVVQEALTNAVRHSAATLIAIDVTSSAGSVSVRVADNGKGIDTERLLNRESWGILGMYERTRHFGGELKITGTPGQGTAVLLHLPLGAKHAE